MADFEFYAPYNCPFIQYLLLENCPFALYVFLIPPNPAFLLSGLFLLPSCCPSLPLSIYPSVIPKSMRNKVSVDNH